MRLALDSYLHDQLLLVTMTDVWIHDNVDGGLYVDNSDAELLGASVIEANVNADGGGGVELFFGTIRGGVVRGNHSDSGGGGVEATFGTIDGTTIEDNTAPTGGGVYVQNAELTVSNAVIDGNVATGEGGGIAFLTVYGEPPPFSITDTTITNNEAARGGGVYTEEAVVASGLTITDNTADRGAGLYVSDDGHTPLVELAGSTVARNTALVGGGGAFLETTGVSSDDSDWGADLDDNLPGDVFVGGPEVVGYGAGSTFVCTEVCTPLP